MTTTVAIIDYGSGNLHSISKSFEAVATKNTTVTLTNDIAVIKKATHIVLPGVGAFGDCIKGLKAIDGILDTLNDMIIEKKQPFLGVCVGMQMLATESLEHGHQLGLNWIKGNVVPITSDNTNLKIPHMGWNELSFTTTHPILNNIKSGDHAYFVHSFHFQCNDNNAILAHVNYGSPITAIVAKDNIIGTQFHPEKSQKTGLTLIKNFMDMS